MEGHGAASGSGAGPGTPPSPAPAPIAGTSAIPVPRHAVGHNIGGGGVIPARPGSNTNTNTGTGTGIATGPGQGFLAGTPPAGIFPFPTQPQGQLLMANGLLPPTIPVHRLSSPGPGVSSSPTIGSPTLSSPSPYDSPSNSVENLATGVAATSHQRRLRASSEPMTQPQAPIASSPSFGESIAGFPSAFQSVKSPIASPTTLSPSTSASSVAFGSPSSSGQCTLPTFDSLPFFFKKPSLYLCNLIQRFVTALMFGGSGSAFSARGQSFSSSPASMPLFGSLSQRQAMVNASPTLDALAAAAAEQALMESQPTTSLPTQYIPNDDMVLD